MTYDYSTPGSLTRELIVRPGERYGSAPAGSTVIVDESECAMQLRCDKFGHPLGALMTLDDAALSISAKSAGSDEGRPKAPNTKQIVDAALERMARGESL